MKRLGTRASLAISGAILVTIGSALMAAPRGFLATSEVILEPDPGLISEVSAPSGMLLIAGSFMVLSAVKMHLAKFGLAAGAFIYGSFGFSRMASGYLHGTPSETLVVVMYFELAVAALLTALNLKIAAPGSSKSLDALQQEALQ